MTVLQYTAEQLITSIRNLGMVPNQVQGTEDSDLLIHINEAMKVLVSELVTIREEYFIRREKVSISSKVRHRIPHRAYLNKLRDIGFWDSDGARVFIQKIPMELLYRYSDTASSAPIGYYVEGNEIVFVPDDGTNFAGNIEFVYIFRPSQLVLSTECRQITYIDTANGILTFATAAPSSWTTSKKFDIHSENSGAEVKCWDLTASSVSGTAMTFTSKIDGSVFGTSIPAVGDWVCLAEECALPGLPRDLHPELIRAVCVRIAEAEGDGQAFQLHQSHLTDEKKKHIKAMEDRIESKPIRIKGRESVLRQGHYYL